VERDGRAVVGPDGQQHVLEQRPRADFHRPAHHRPADALAAGGRPNFTFNPFEAAETMTGHIARISGGDLSYNSIDYNSIFAIGLTLFILTLTLNAFSRRLVRRFREVYE
jgi:hypothetical protein